MIDFIVNEIISYLNKMEGKSVTILRKIYDKNPFFFGIATFDDLKEYHEYMIKKGYIKSYPIQFDVLRFELIP